MMRLDTKKYELLKDYNLPDLLMPSLDSDEEISALHKDFIDGDEIAKLFVKGQPFDWLLVRLQESVVVFERTSKLHKEKKKAHDDQLEKVDGWVVKIKHLVLRLHNEIEGNFNKGIRSDKQFMGKLWGIFYK